jgi:hypothetical protein
MHLYTYALVVDDGAAPNPYGGVCTLTICKPAIRRTAQVGDWIVGFGSKKGPNGVGRSWDIIYAMQVSNKLSYEQYDEHCRRNLRAKLPDWSPNAPFEHQSRRLHLRANRNGSIQPEAERT